MAFDCQELKGLLTYLLIPCEVVHMHYFLYHLISLLSDTFDAVMQPNTNYADKSMLSLGRLFFETVLCI